MPAGLGEGWPLDVGGHQAGSNGEPAGLSEGRCHGNSHNEYKSPGTSVPIFNVGTEAALTAKRAAAVQTLQVEEQ